MPVEVVLLTHSENNTPCTHQTKIKFGQKKIMPKLNFALKNKSDTPHCCLNLRGYHHH